MLCRTLGAGAVWAVLRLPFARRLWRCPAGGVSDDGGAGDCRGGGGGGYAAVFRRGRRCGAAAHDGGNRRRCLPFLFPGEYPAVSPPRRTSLCDPPARTGQQDFRRIRQGGHRHHAHRAFVLSPGGGDLALQSPHGRTGAAADRKAPAKRERISENFAVWRPGRRLRPGGFGRTAGVSAPGFLRVAHFCPCHFHGKPRCYAADCR